MKSREELEEMLQEAKENYKIADESVRQCIKYGVLTHCDYSWHWSEMRGIYYGQMMILEEVLK